MTTSAVGAMMGDRGGYAGAGVRFAAIVVDVILMSLVFFPVTRIVKGTWVMDASDHRWAKGPFVTDPLCLVFLVVMFLYFVLFEGVSGATPGKRLLGLEVIRADGGRAGLLRAVVRNVLRIVDGLPALGMVAAVLMATSEERARFGDRVAETRVVQSRAGKKERSARLL